MATETQSQKEIKGQKEKIINLAKNWRERGLSGKERCYRLTQLQYAVDELVVMEMLREKLNNQNEES